MSNIITNVSYFTPSRYVSGRIVEYDIKSANISMLKRFNRIDDNFYNYLKNLPKIDREIEIGLLIKNNKSIYDTIRDGIKIYKQKLVETNNIDDSKIIRIANDAVYINSPLDLQYTVFDNIIEFKQKAIYNVATKLGNVIIFSSFNLNGEMNMDIIGLGKNSIYHQNYMASFIGTVIYMIEKSELSEAFKYIDEFVEHYLKLELDIQYYREFNSGSLFAIKDSPYKITSCNDLSQIDIGYNFYIIGELRNILVQLYNIRRN